MNNSIYVEEELTQNFIDFAWDTNNNKAFPSVYDGLKPGQRACLWEMYHKGYVSSKPHVKSAKVAGGVIASLWPHSDTAIYETFVRMAQNFVEKIPEVDFQGASGNIILGQDSFASSRYTEVRLSKIAEEGMFRGIEKNNVPMIPNFSEDEEWPKVLPSIFPRLLVNGSMGIGVGVSQIWVTHNFTETANLILDYLKDNILKEETYYPDFPTGGIIVNQDELSKINKTGKGKIILEGKYQINNNQIVFTEFPYQVYIEPLITKIQELVLKEELNGIENVINTSDKKQISLTIICERNYSPEKVVEELLEKTSLRTTIHVNQNAIVDVAPILLNLRQIVDCYIEHNLECIQKEFQFDLDKTNSRIEILEGLIAALANIDDIVNIIRKSDSPTEAKNTLMDKYSFTENQAKSILDMKLARLTKLDGVKLNDELQEKQEYAAKCAEIVNSEDSRKQVLVERLTELRDKFGDKRRTQVIQKTITKKSSNGTTKQSEPVEDVVITYNPLGYLQRIPVSNYRKSNFKGFKCTTEDLVLLFSNQGRFFRISPKDIKSCGMKDKGTAIGSIIKLNQGEKIIGVFSSIIDEKHPYLTFVLNNGIIKKSESTSFYGTTRNLTGMTAIKLKDDSLVIGVQLTNGNDIVLSTENNMFIRFSAEDVRPMGRNAAGVKAINLADGDSVREMIICEPTDKTIKTSIGELTITKQGRGGKGKRYGS